MFDKIDDACPFEARFRASVCQQCCDASDSVPPCVKAWLRQETSTAAAPALPLMVAPTFTRELPRAA
ncbi:MAG: hypothetical protein HY875_12180 [Chloroflexi bacterium]|nr:hypothetical protein [Chloroflexota bacterium]